jgi:hypothetical protein
VRVMKRARLVSSQGRYCVSIAEENNALDTLLRACLKIFDSPVRPVILNIECVGLGRHKLGLKKH